MRNPYITGSYVTGIHHYGREQLLDFLLRGPSRACWVVGNRRIGKTSLLRQLEVAALEDARLVPLFWDMQGCASFSCMGGYLADAVRDHPERFEPLGVTATLLDERDPLVLLSTLRRLAKRAGRELLLLCDETEVLITAARDEPEAMQRFHAQVTGGAALRAIFSSTRQVYRMHDVCREWDTSPFLAGFDMSHTLGSLTPEAACALVTQAQAPEERRVRASDAVVAAIRAATNDHPYLLQLLCARLFSEDGALRFPAEEDLRVDALLSGFFEHDFRQLTQEDRRVVLAVHRLGTAAPADLQAASGESPLELTRRLYNLEALGYLRCAGDRFAAGNRFLAAWLDLMADFLAELPAAPTTEGAMHAAFARQGKQDRASLVTQLNARRARLVELEAVRAREFAAVTAEVLEEIEQLETEIRELRHLLAEIPV